MKTVKRLCGDEKGSALVIVALAMIVLLGSSAIVVDYGMLAVKRRTLVNAADAAALAGAQELLHNPNSPNSAILIAREYAIDNGVDPDLIEVVVSPSNSLISVHVADLVNFAFASVLGFETGHVTAEASAAVGAVNGMTGIVPLAIVEESFIKGQEYELKSFSPPSFTFGPGNFGALALGGPGASRFESNLRDGYNGMIQIGDLLDTEPGVMSNPIKRAFNDRANRCESSCTYNNFSPECPLLVYIPIIKQPTGQGKQKVEVVGFAAFFLDKNQPPGQGNESIIKGRFVDTIAQGQITPGTTGYGVSAVNLVK
jgi:hypothetical protein